MLIIQYTFQPDGPDFFLQYSSLIIVGNLELLKKYFVNQLKYPAVIQNFFGKHVS